ncbi:unnamed protein product [Tilletia laevis]|uniref:Uncharacterized protein n=3 Tax=Tilletia TaxID=13289 RepID=A0A8X7MIT1_9BASI|nr:hypothetical protein CF336_g9217 [Tilletia laevis]KAE8180991.1 hypothetical protein CF328_g8981 [Tilletia controversa]KAE8237884.1 hypothetical protein A4X03_0g9014 [Tilletia caries]KAE8237658.1 hypothetical protein A4X06_0g9164 [Tilletia controversa]CAD6892355.1 unnamed protein product [Tilletia caries]
MTRSLHEALAPQPAYDDACLRPMYDDTAALSAWCTTTPKYAPSANDDAQAAAGTALRSVADPSCGKTETEVPTSIQMTSAERSARAETTRSGTPRHNTTTGRYEVRRHLPARLKPTAAHTYNPLVDLTPDNPYVGSHPPPNDSTARVPPCPFCTAPQQQHPSYVKALKYLAATGFQLADPTLAPLVQNPAAAVTVALSVACALITQRNDSLEIPSMCDATEKRGTECFAVDNNRSRRRPTAALGITARTSLAKHKSATPSSRQPGHFLRDGMFENADSPSDNQFNSLQRELRQTLPEGEVYPVKFSPLNSPSSAGSLYRARSTARVSAYSPVEPISSLLAPSTNPSITVPSKSASAKTRFG